MSTELFIASLLQVADLGSPLWEILLLSLRVSLSAVAIAAVLGLPLGVLLVKYRLRGERVVLVLLNTLMSLPPVVVGLIVYLALSRDGPFGVFNLLYTPTAMIIAQVILITPIIAALSRGHLLREWSRIGEQLRSLGLSSGSCTWILLQESRAEIGTVLLAGFGRAIAEIGAVMIVGGNIEHLTRVMTTAIALETSKGNLELAVALGLVLLLISLLVNAAVSLLGHQEAVR